MSYNVRYTPAARDDLTRHYRFLLDKNFRAAEKAVDTITRAIGGLAEFPFSARKAAVADDAFVRELIIPFGVTGYVALFKITDSETVTILAVRHQREDDYH